MICARVHLEVLPYRLWLHARSHLNTALQMPSPASLEVETMPYPTARPDTSVFEPMSEEYASVASPGAPHFAPLSSSETLASLVLKGNFRAAESLRKEMISHRIQISHDVLYLRAALHVVTERRQKGSARERLDEFAAWLSLAPDRHEKWQSFCDIRHRLFRSMDHLNLTLVYRFGIILASKGYYSESAAMQVVSTLARYARTPVVKRYLCEVEDASRDYHLRENTVPPPDFLACSHSLSIRTVALAGKAEAALDLIAMANSRGIQIPDFTLNLVAVHALDRQTTIDRIRAVYPSWTMQNVNRSSTGFACEANPAGYSTEIAVLAERLRSLRTAFRSYHPPSPHALQKFIFSYRDLGRTRALALLSSLAYRHSPKSASTWAFAEMLHHRSQDQLMYVLFVFFRHFHLVGVPRKTLLSFIRGRQGKEARKEYVKPWVDTPCLVNQKLWPSAYHTALVWETIVSLSPKTEKERLYALLLSLVRQSRREESGRDDFDSCQVRGAEQAKIQLPPDTFDAAHFSPFVSLWARSSPAKAAGILQDMIRLGIEPSMIQWSMVARGYAQHDDPLVALSILERLDEIERGKTNDACSGEGVTTEYPSDVLLGVHTNVLRGFVLAGDVKHAGDVERRLVERFGYQAGDRPTTDASIALLRSLESRIYTS